jgi:hypothetical protein
VNQKSGKVNIADDPFLTGAVEELDEGGSFSRARLAAKNQDNARVGDILRFSHEVFPVACDDDVTPIGGIAQTSRVIRRDGKDVPKKHYFVPERAQGIGEIMRRIMIEEERHARSLGAICRATRTSISPL